MTAAPPSPSLDTAEFRLVAAACAAVARGAPLPAAADDINVDAVVALVDRHRLSAPVMHVLAEALAGRAPALSRQVRRQRLLGLEQARQTALLSQALQARDIPHVVVKGAPLAQALYGDPVARASKDIDLLVDPQRMADADAVMVAHGFHRSDAQVDDTRKHRDYRMGMIQVELHNRLIDLPEFVPLDFTEIWSRRTSVLLMGGQVPVMGDIDTFLYLCAHGSEHVWFRLKWLQDIARIVATDPGGRVAAAQQAAVRVGFDRVVAASLRLVDEMFAIAPGDAALLRDDGPTRRAVDLAREAIAAPAELAHVPTLGWIVRRSLVQLRSRRDWRYRRALLLELATAPRSFDPVRAGAWSLFDIPARAVRFWQSRR